MTELAGTTGLIDRHVAFVAALRGAGLPVSLAESLDATQAMATIDLRYPGATAGCVRPPPS